ncbi:MAG: formate dehydrogenase subunit gamma [Acidobacteriia bacterium]|nr:formate dehydrogenase subunit gamma [Terriglobia bacterium]
MSSGRALPLNSAAGASGQRLLRYTLAERVNHWIATLSYIYLLLTGLAFWSPYLFWLVIFSGGGPTARFWHPWVGLLFTASVLYMYALWRGDMLLTPADLVWRRSLLNYIRNEDENLPPVGRFNMGQKQFFWLMLGGGILLALSGFGLWFADALPWSLRYLRYLAIFLHVVFALATIGGFIIHVYMGTAVVRGGFTSIIRGEVSAGWARLHHRLWYDQVTGGSPRKK